MSKPSKWHHTTVLCVRHGGRVAMASDGQVTHGTTVMKQTAAKIRRLKGGEVLAGFAGSTADAFALFSRFEARGNSLTGRKKLSSLRRKSVTVCLNGHSHCPKG